MQLLSEAMAKSGS